MQTTSIQKAENEFLSKFPFFARLPEEERDHLLKTVTYREVAAGTVMISENTRCSGVTFVLSGEFKVFKVSENGREIALYTVSSGETCVLTVSCLLGLNANQSPVSAVATQDSRIAVLPSDVFTYLYTSSPFIQQYIFQNIVEKFYGVIDLVEHLTFHSVTERLWEYLRINTGDGKKPLYSTHAQIASRLGTSREVVTRRLKELEQEGRIHTERGKIALVKVE